MEGQCGQGQGQVFRIAIGLTMHCACPSLSMRQLRILVLSLVLAQPARSSENSWLDITNASSSTQLEQHLRWFHIHFLSLEQAIFNLITCHVIMFKLIDYDPRFAVSLCTWRSCNPGEGNVINCTWGILCRKGFQRPAGETGDIGQQVGASWCKIQQVVLVCMMGQHHHHSKHVCVCKYCAMVLMVWHGMIWHYAEYIIGSMYWCIGMPQNLNFIMRFKLLVLRSHDFVWFLICCQMILWYYCMACFHGLGTSLSKSQGRVLRDWLRVRTCKSRGPPTRSNIGTRWKEFDQCLRDAAPKRDSQCTQQNS